MKVLLHSLLFLFVLIDANAQAENEIQVYASPTIQHKWTIVELHTNYTFRGVKSFNNPVDAKWFNTTLEITTGIEKNAELGFYTFFW